MSTLALYPLCPRTVQLLWEFGVITENINYRITKWLHYIIKCIRCIKNLHKIIEILKWNSTVYHAILFCITKFNVIIIFHWILLWPSKCKSNWQSHCQKSVIYSYKATFTVELHMCHPRKEGTPSCRGHCEGLLCTERVSSRTNRDQCLVSIFCTTLHTHVLQNRSEERASVSMGRTWGMNVLYGHCLKVSKFMIKTFRWRHQCQFFCCVSPK